MVAERDIMRRVGRRMSRGSPKPSAPQGGSRLARRGATASLSSENDTGQRHRSPRHREQRLAYPIRQAVSAIGGGGRKQSCEVTDWQLAAECLQARRCLPRT